MNRSYLAVGVVGLALAGLWKAAAGPGTGSAPAPIAPTAAAPAPAVAPTEALRVTTPAAHENLHVYFIHGPNTVDDSRVVSLQEALEKGWAVVHETGDVNTLVVENTSADRDLFVQSGDLIKGGRQDRMIAQDMLLPPGAGRVAFPAHCVESGRWTGRGQEASTKFAVSTDAAVSKELKIANANRDQQAVWANVAVSQTKLSENLKVQVQSEASKSSLQLALENPAVRGKVAEYEAALRRCGDRQAGVVGVVFAVNGQVTGAEVYGSNGLFLKAWPKLLRSAAVEALAEKKDGPCAACPTVRQVEDFLARNAEGEPAGGRAAAEEVASAGRPPAALRPLQEQAWGNMTANVLLPDITDGTSSTLILQEYAANPAPRVYSGRTFYATPAQPQGGQQDGQVRQAARAVARTEQTANRGYGGGRADNTPFQMPAPQPAQADANRLNTNRIETAGCVTLEARDVARPGVVVHRSYIAK